MARDATTAADKLGRELARQGFSGASITGSNVRVDPLEEDSDLNARDIPDRWIISRVFSSGRVYLSPNL